MKSEDKHYDSKGRLYSPIKQHSIEKQESVAYYAGIFSTAMRYKYEKLVYIDLFSGGGQCFITKGNRKGDVVNGVAVRVLDLKTPFDEYHFCEKDPELFSALSQRVNEHPLRNSCFLYEGDCRENLNTIKAKMAKPSIGASVLYLCFVDVFGLGNISLKQIVDFRSKYFMDLFLLFPTYFDVHRNWKNYINISNHSVDYYLGSSSWRKEWSQYGTPTAKGFGVFILKKTYEVMNDLGFYGKLTDAQGIKMHGYRDRTLYHLCFFSKNMRGLDFWRKTKDRDEQLDLGFF